MKNDRILNVKGVGVSIMSVKTEDYISLTDIARHKNKLLRGSNSTPLGMKLGITRSFYLHTNGSKRLMQLALFQNLSGMAALSRIKI